MFRIRYNHEAKQERYQREGYHETNVHFVVLSFTSTHDEQQHASDPRDATHASSLVSPDCCLTQGQTQTQTKTTSVSTLSRDVANTVNATNELQRVRPINLDPILIRAGGNHPTHDTTNTVAVNPSLDGDTTKIVTETTNSHTSKRNPNDAVVRSTIRPVRDDDPESRRNMTMISTDTDTGTNNDNNTGTDTDTDTDTHDKVHPWIEVKWYKKTFRFIMPRRLDLEDCLENLHEKLRFEKIYASATTHQRRKFDELWIILNDFVRVQYQSLDGWAIEKTMSVLQGRASCVYAAVNSQSLRGILRFGQTTRGVERIKECTHKFAIQAMSIAQIRHMNLDKWVTQIKQLELLNCLFN